MAKWEVFHGDGVAPVTGGEVGRAVQAVRVSMAGVVAEPDRAVQAIRIYVVSAAVDPIWIAFSSDELG